ncbi:unnamed protein product [Ostreobium quekettii]|uniref:Uncharacterized protein n=1 Tax=Ostreobium quekettii TaxID=121088 RepID=A0A8S1JI20_9CHLO|nr:unnamed protein product [Ostreobium quekettii]
MALGVGAFMVDAWTTMASATSALGSPSSVTSNIPPVLVGCAVSPRGQLRAFQGASIAETGLVRNGGLQPQPIRLNLIAKLRIEWQRQPLSARWGSWASPNAPVSPFGPSPNIFAISAIVRDPPVDHAGLVWQI